MRAKLTGIIIILLITTLACECVSRYFVYKNFGEGAQRIWLFYPELYAMPASLDRNKINILVLGGSAVTDTLCHISQNLKKEFGKEGIAVNVFNLARFAHNTLDSKIKFSHCKDLGFDYVFVYNGINDTRANNCPDNIFKEDYSHIHFYSQVQILERHPGIDYFSLPFILDYYWNELKIKIGLKKVIPKEYLVANWKLIAPEIQGHSDNEKEQINTVFKKVQDKVIGPDLLTVDSIWWSDGVNIKSAKSFRNNLEWIYHNKPSKTKLVLTDYAWYQPKDYSLQKFLYEKLDYAEQRWPTEIYGKPENVAKGLIRHNMIIDSIAMEYPDIVYFNFEDSIPHRAAYFNDICHLADSGQILLAHTLATQIIRDIRKRKR